MTRRRAFVVLAGCVAVAAAGVTVGAAGVPRAASAVRVPGSAARIASAVTRAGATPASQRLTVQVWLKPKLSAATSFANSVATPGSSLFHRYLTPDAYTAAFGPTAAQAAAVATWLASRGLTQVHADSGRDYVSATGPASNVQSAFGTRISQYRVMSAGGAPAVAYANDGEASVPAALAPDVLAVTGLDSLPSAAAPAESSSTAGTATAKAPTCSNYWAQYVTSFRPSYQGLTKGSLPVCGYTADQIRAAYGATMAATGKGQTVAMTEPGPPTAMFQTLTDFAKASNLPAPKPAQYREQQVDKTCPSASSATRQPADNAQNPPDEQAMDSEAVYAMAPGASQLMLYTDCLDDQSLIDTDLAVLTGDGGHPSASIVSNSWIIASSLPLATMHAMALRAVAEGVGMYFASGDSPGPEEPAADPYVTAVGGTTLGIGSKGNRLFETGWSDDQATLEGGKWDDIGASDSSGGGGSSPDYPQPAYQKGVVPAAMSQARTGNGVVADRTVPDIAADADAMSGMMTGQILSVTNGQPGPYLTQPGAGTSQACPLIAGLVADAQQGQATSFGFVNPLLYRLAGTRAFHDILPVTAKMPQQYRDAYTPVNDLGTPEVDVFDSQQPAYTKQVTAEGYDTMTGLGTPNGKAFILGLRRLADRAS